MLVSPVANVWRMGLGMQFAINSQSDRQTFVDVRKHSPYIRSCGVVNIRNRFLKFARKAYSYCFRKHRNIFLLMARHL